MNPITMKLVVDDLILQALREDITFEDVSTASVCPTARPATVELIAKADGIIAGLDVFARTFELLDSQSSVLLDVADGDEVHAGDHVGQVRGDARVLLSGERVALNYLQRMSGIATYTHQMAAALEGTKTVLVDTRKTTPGMRVFEKAAVEIGGGIRSMQDVETVLALGVSRVIIGSAATTATTCRRPSCSRTTTSMPPVAWRARSRWRAPMRRLPRRSRSSARTWTWCARPWRPVPISSCSTT